MEISTISIYFIGTIEELHELCRARCIRFLDIMPGIIGRVAQYALGIDQTEAEIDNARRRFAKENLVHYDYVDRF
jgi:hypothetical protein